MAKKVLFFLGVVCILCITPFNFHSQCFATGLTEPLGAKFEGNITAAFPSIFYDLNAEAYKNEDWYKIANGKTLSEDSDSLHIFAFNVGQGNCIILRKQKDVIIIDAGKGSGDIHSMILPKIKAILGSNKEKVNLKGIFITHGDQDHINLFKEILQDLVPKSSTEKTPEIPVYFGKTKKTLSKIFGGMNEFFKPFDENKNLSDESNETKLESTVSLSGIEFKLVFPGKSGSSGTNPNSLIIKVTYKGQSVLFTGDAEEESLVRRIGYVNDKVQNEQLKNYLPNLVEDNIKKEDEDQTQDNLFINNRQDLLKDISAVFLPHHGTVTKGSQRWLTSLSGFSRSITWFVSSSPDGNDRIPERSIYEACPSLPKRNLHAISYRAGEKGSEGSLRYKFTEKPLYITGAAPGGVYWLRISSDGKIALYDACPKVKKEDLRNGISDTNLQGAINSINEDGGKTEDRGWQDISARKGSEEKKSEKIEKMKKTAKKGDLLLNENMDKEQNEQNTDIVKIDKKRENRKRIKLSNQVGAKGYQGDFLKQDKKKTRKVDKKNLVVKIDVKKKEKEKKEEDED